VSVAVVASPPTPSAKPLPSAESHGPFNVILILIDSWRSETQWTGHREPNTPHLTELAKTSTVYTNAYSISSTTARSVAPLLVGRYPSEMPRTGDYFTHWYPQNEFVSERLRARGARTLAVHAHAYFSMASGMAQGFSDYVVLPGTVLNDPDPQRTGERTTETARRLLRRAADPQGKKPFFAYFHYLDPHAPYLDPDHEPDAGVPVDPRIGYRAEVSYTDEWVGVLLDWVKRQRFGSRTVVIVSADHGECFGEHGNMKHGYELWQELVHVPLLIHLPDGAPHTVDLPRSQIDLAPTILELMGAPPDEKHLGKSLVPELYGARPEPRPVVVDLPRDTLQDRRRAVIDGTSKLIARGDDERWLLYDIEKDPKESHNLTEIDRPRFERMKKLYEEISSRIGNEEIHGDAALAGAPAGRRW
jgi:choline-sulfatase